MTDWTFVVPADLGSRATRALVRSLDGLGTVEAAVDRSALPQLVAAATDGIAIAGSDADLAALAAAVIEADAAERLRLGLVPTGETSSLLRMFGLPHRSGPADHLRGDGEYRCDLVHLTTSTGPRIVVAWAGAGNAAGRPGRLLRRGAPAEVTARTPNRTLVHRAYGVLLANSQFWGPANPAPRAMLVDGRFDLQILLGRRSRALATAMERGAHTRRRDVVRASVAGVVLDADRPWPVIADGEPAGQTPFHAVALEQAVRIAI